MIIFRNANTARFILCAVAAALKVRAGILNAISIKNFLAGLRLNTKSGKGQVMPIKNLFVFPNAVNRKNDAETIKLNIEGKVLNFYPHF